MKFTCLVVAAFFFALPAHSQMTCAEINKLVELAPDGFKGVRGTEIDDNFYEGTLRPSGVEECTVAIDYDYKYTCLVPFDSKFVLAAAFETQWSIIRDCMIGWSILVEPPTSDRELRSYWRMLNGERISIFAMRTTPFGDPTWIKLVVGVSREGK